MLYSPLNGGEIRVLELLPATWDDPLRGKLHAISIDFEYPRRPSGPGLATTYKRWTNHGIDLSTGKPAWYTALSYVWGSNVFDQVIHFNDEVVNITSSLSVALQNLRSTEDGVFLWIDQIWFVQTRLIVQNTI